VGEKWRIFKGLGLVAEVGGHPAGEGDDIGGMGHLDFGFWILDFGFWILDWGLRIVDFWLERVHKLF